jgi:hypothetical protein
MLGHDSLQPALQAGLEELDPLALDVLGDEEMAASGDGRRIRGWRRRERPET